MHSVVNQHLEPYRSQNYALVGNTVHLHMVHSENALMLASKGNIFLVDHFALTDRKSRIYPNRETLVSKTFRPS